MLYQIIRVVFTTGCAKSVWPQSSHKEITQNLNLSKTKTFFGPTFLKRKQCPHNVEAYLRQSIPLFLRSLLTWFLALIFTYVQYHLNNPHANQTGYVGHFKCSAFKSWQQKTVSFIQSFGMCDCRKFIILCKTRWFLVYLFHDTQRQGRKIMKLNTPDQLDEVWYTAEKIKLCSEIQHWKNFQPK